MNKKTIKPILILGLSISTLAVIPFVGLQPMNAKAEEPTMYHVDFFNNYLRQDFVLSSGYGARGNNVLYTTVDAAKDSLVSKPADPTRKNYEFKGWYQEEECVFEWDFASNKVTSNTRLFAKWGLSESGDIVEPSYTPPSTVQPDSASEDYVINSVMNFKLDGTTLRLSRSALARLEALKDNVLPLMEYKVKANKAITATYADSKITVTVTGHAAEIINVVDNTEAYKITSDDDKDNYQNYESKAKKYEDKIAEEGENYHVMLAGSSSIEFWSNSKEVLNPIVSYNHGIGGTTIEQWENKLNQRLVYPYKPKMAVYYVGINNIINRKENVTTVYNRLVSFFEKTHADLPDTQIQYILMNCLPDYNSGYNTTILGVNDKVRTYAESNGWLTLIDPGSKLMKPTGDADAAYFRSDCVHLSEYGYIIWGNMIKESILEGLEAMSK